MVTTKRDNSNKRHGNPRPTAVHLPARANPATPDAFGCAGAQPLDPARERKPEAPALSLSSDAGSQASAITIPVCKGIRVATIRGALKPASTSSDINSRGRLARPSPMAMR